MNRRKIELELRVRVVWGLESGEFVMESGSAFCQALTYSRLSEIVVEGGEAELLHVE